MSKTSSDFAVLQLMCVRQNEILFKNVNFELNAGELLIIEGSNGSGKSTLLRMLAGLSSPLVGDVLWQEQSIYSHHQTFHSQVHYLGHHNGLKQSLTVNENLQLLEVHNQKPIDTSMAIKTLGLEKISSILIKNLSAGQKRRVALVKLFCIPKKLWLLDEPLAALDVATQKLLTQHLALHLQLGGMAIMSTHQPVILQHPLTKIIRLPMLTVTLC